MPEYSIVVPVYNEEESVRPLFAEIQKAMGSLSSPYEVVFVNDCSSDNSLSILKDIKMTSGDVVNIIDLNQRSGQTFALKKGLENIRGNVAITLDADLQNDPGDIPKLIHKMEEGYDVVCGWRRDRHDKPLKACLSKFGNVLQRIFTGMSIHDVSCTLRAYKKACVGKIALNREGQHRFIPLSLSLQGYRVGEIVSNHRNRQFGNSKYGHKRIFKVIIDFFRILLTRGKK